MKIDETLSKHWTKFGGNVRPDITSFDLVLKQIVKKKK